MTENQNSNPEANSEQCLNPYQSDPAGRQCPSDPVGSRPPADGTGRKKRRVPLVPAIAAGAALFVVGGLAGGALGATTVMASVSSGTGQQGPGGQQGGPGGQQGGPGSQQGGDSQQDGASSSADDSTADGGSDGGETSSQTESGGVENAAFRGVAELLSGYVVLNRER